MRLHNLDELQARSRAVNGRLTLNVPTRAASLQIQSSSGSRGPPSTRTGGELQPRDSVTLRSRPWPGPGVSRVLGGTGAAAADVGGVGHPVPAEARCHATATVMWMPSIRASGAAGTSVPSWNSASERDCPE